jgi:hypothetical protein
MDENQRVKLEFIKAYLNDAEDKLLFLSELAATGHKDEAMTLCLVYIDRFAQVLKWPSIETGKNFVEALIQFGQDPFMGLCHPLQAARAFTQVKQLEILGRQVATVFPGPSHELMDLPTFEAQMKREIPQFDRSQFRKHAWRATLANVAYQRLRIPAIHGSGVSGALEFSQTTYNGDPVPILDLRALKNCVSALIAEARRRSEANGQWFGNDASVGWN